MRFARHDNGLVYRFYAHSHVTTQPRRTADNVNDVAGSRTRAHARARARTHFVLKQIARQIFKPQMLVTANYHSSSRIVVAATSPRRICIGDSIWFVVTSALVLNFNCILYLTYRLDYFNTLHYFSMGYRCVDADYQKKNLEYTKD